MLRIILLIFLIMLTSCQKTMIGSTVPEDYEGVCVIENNPQDCLWHSEEFKLQYSIEKSRKVAEYLLVGEVEYNDSERYYQLSNGFITLLLLEKNQDGWAIYDTKPGTMRGSYDASTLIFRNEFSLTKAPDAVTTIFRFEAKGN